MYIYELDKVKGSEMSTFIQNAYAEHYNFTVWLDAKVLSLVWFFSLSLSFLFVSTLSFAICLFVCFWWFCGSPKQCSSYKTKDTWESVN